MKKLFLLLALIITFGVSAQEKWGNVDKNKVTMKEIAPVWPGCENKGNDCFDQKLQEHIQKNFKYPANAWKNNVQERIVITFVVDKNGLPVIKEVEGKNQELIDEAKRIIMAMPKVKPGMLAGKPTEIQYTVPFTFKTGK